MELQMIKILVPATVAFTIGILITPLITHYLYAFKVWKKTGGKTAIGGREATEFNRLKGIHETKTPRMGGIVIWASIVLTLILLYGLSQFLPHSIWPELYFLSRSQTWIPVSVLIAGALIGLLNDYYDVVHGGRGLRLSIRLLIITGLASVISWWFYSKLGVDSINLPFFDILSLGWLIIPFFIFLTITIYASGVIDGIDGLSGGVFAAIYFAYAGVAYIQSQFDIAALAATIGGATLAFLWFNVPPARFWMTETGSMALTLTLAVIVFMTDQIGSGYGIFLFPIIALPLVATVASNVLQISYRHATGKKLFRIAPLHHHFEAIGWPAHKVTMRYWIFSILCAILGIILASILYI